MGGNPQRSPSKLGVTLALEPRYPESWPKALLPVILGCVKGFKRQVKKIGPREKGMFERNTPGPRSELCLGRIFTQSGEEQNHPQSGNWAGKGVYFRT